MGKDNTKGKHSDIKNIICLIIVCTLAFILLHDICGSSILGHSGYDSYELQAQAWLSGQTHLDRNYSHLELAVFNDNYYVSFPPFPSVVLLPFVIVFGAEHTPNNLIMAVICIATVVLVYKILRRYGTKELTSAFFALFYVFGSNMLAMALNGGVWFIAQALNMLLCIMALDFCLKNNRLGTYIVLGLAVGCRPFSAIYIIAAFVYFIMKDGKLKWKDFLMKEIFPALPLIAIASAYMTYNYVRFRNPLEFGHNYLPEFTESTHGQFSTTYLFDNLRKLFIEPIRIDSNLNISFTNFNGFWFYIANPIFLIAAYRAIRNIIQSHHISPTRLILLCSMVLNIVFLCLHKTLGGWQFGARYTCDFMVAAFACILITVTAKEPIKRSDPTQYMEQICALSMNRAEILIAVFGLMFNAFGAVEFWLRLI